MPGDGLCIISAFKEGLSSVGRQVSTEFLLETLRSKILRRFDFYIRFDSIVIPQEGPLWKQGCIDLFNAIPAIFSLGYFLN